MIIDFHTHVFPPAIKSNRSAYIARDPHFASLYADPKSKIVTAEELVAGMDRSGIAVSVILGFNWASHELCLENNNYILDSVTRHPERLVGFCSVNLTAGETAIKEIERCARLGIKGVGELRPDRQLLKNKEVMQPFTEVLKQNNLILLTHASEPVGHQYSGKGDITPDTIYPLLTGFPHLKVVCAHWGGGLPFYALMPEVKKALGNVYFDTAASPFLYSPRIYEYVSRLVGAEKILFGSDYPLMPPKRLLDEIASLNLPDQTRDMILAGNARKLLGMGR